MPIHGYPGNVITANPTAPTSSVATGVWTTEQQLLAVSQGNWPGYEYPLERSLRFNSADSAYLNRTPASAGNRRTWTWSGWVKRSAMGATQGLFGAYSAANNTDNLWLGFSGGDLFIISRNSDELRRTTQVFRDVSAWYHIVVALDTTQATANDRVKVYLNGTQITTFTTTNNPTQNDNQGINQAAEHRIGRRPDSTDYLNSYLTEINFVDGQALEPSSFGLNDPETGVWSPKRYTGTYGTNGFYLNFSDNSGTTSTTLGKDSSGNGNNWTPNNFSVTAGAGNDSLVDSPTSYGTDTGVGGEVRGNYCTLNPLDVTGTITVSNGNLQATASSDVNTFTVRGTFGVSLGSWYWECVKLVTGDTGASFGIMSLSQAISGAPTGCYGIRDDGNKVVNGSYSAFGSSFTTATVGLAFNATSGTLEIFLNNVSQGTISSIPAGTYAPFISDTSTGAGTNAGGIANFGQRAFAYTAPSGFKALCTQNLPTPTIGATSTTQANKYMDVTLYTGNGAVRSITNSGSMQPDFVWDKLRSGANSHRLFDSLRGVEKALYSNLSNAEATETGTLTSFNSNGFSLGTNTETNTNGSTYVAWQWNAGGSTVTNTSGTISSQVRANTTSGFSIVTYTGTGANATVGHGLGVAPSMVIVKERGSAGNPWITWHTSLAGGSYNVQLNTTAAQANATTVLTATPTSTVINVGTDSSVNGSTRTYVSYCFAPVAGYSAFGSYTGNGSTDGPFVYLGFRPRFIMFKMTSSTSNWLMIDTQRSQYNQTNEVLLPNSSSAEGTGAGYGAYDILSNGFKPRNSVANETNVNGGTYIYAAFAESPFKYSRAR